MKTERIIAIISIIACLLLIAILACILDSQKHEVNIKCYDANHNEILNNTCLSYEYNSEVIEILAPMLVVIIFFLFILLLCSLIYLFICDSINMVAS